MYPSSYYEKQLNRRRKRKAFRRKMHYHCNPEYCTPELCAIYGKHDKRYQRNDIMEICFKQPNRLDIEPDSLGQPVGLVCSRLRVQHIDDASQAQAVLFATYLKAFAFIYILPEIDWTASNIDMLLEAGRQLYRETTTASKTSLAATALSNTSEIEVELRRTEMEAEQRAKAGAAAVTVKKKTTKSYKRHSLLFEHPSSKVTLKTPSNKSSKQTMSREKLRRDIPQYVYTENELRVKRNFTIEEHIFSIELQMPFSNRSRTFTSHDYQHQIKHLKLILRAYYKTRRHGLLWISTYGYLLVWRIRRAYFVLDMNGRECHTFERRSADAAGGGGHAMLLCLKSLDNVIYLITQLSGVDIKDKFTIRELTVVRLETPEGRSFARDTNYRTRDYAVISNNYAYLRSNLHLTLNPRELLRNRASIMVCIAGIIVSKIDHPATWTAYVYDHIICYGVKLCRSCWDACLDRPINLDKFPTQLRIGQFVAELKLLPSIQAGFWRCGKPYKDNDFERYLMGTLSMYKYIIFQINNQMYAIWHKDYFYYLLDPYRHSIVGQLEDDVGDVIKSTKKANKYATVRMFRKKDTLLKVFHSILMESNRTAPFYIHAVQLRNLLKIPEGYALPTFRTDANDDAAAEVRSLNETVIFPEEYEEQCGELARISDFNLEVESYTKIPFDEYFRLLDQSPSLRFPAGAVEEEEEEGGGRGAGADIEGIEDKDSDDEKARTRKKHAPKLKIKGIARKPKSKKSTNKTTEEKFTPTAVATSPPPADEPRPVMMETSLSQFHLLPQVAGKRKTSKKKRQLNQKQPQIPSNIPRIQLLSNLTLMPTQHQQLHDVDMDLTAYNPMQYPGYNDIPQNMAVCGSESGTMESVARLIRSAFRCADRVLAMTPWGNYVIFRVIDEVGGKTYYVFDGCTCDIDRFRHLDLRYGTAGFKPFFRQYDVVCHIIDSREGRALEQLRTRLNATNEKFEKICGRCP